MVKLRRRGRGQGAKVSRHSALSYYRSGPPPAKSPFQRSSQPNRRGFLSKTLDWLVIIIIAAGLIYSLLLRPDPIMAVSSLAYRSTDTYIQVTVKALADLKNRNKLTFDEAGLEANLKRKFPEISSVSVDLPLFGLKPTIHINVAQPSLILRGAEGTFGAAEQFVIDSKGAVVGLKSSLLSVKELPTVTDETGFRASIGRSVLSQGDVNFILTLVAQANKAKVPVASLSLPRLAQQVDLRTTDRNYFIKFYLGGDALIQSGQFLAARRQFDQSNKQPQQYLDVRVAGKIYYK
ncbi:MAG TPA: hypothetical protein VIK37_02595 [Candidatus Saccharimonadales bacterium]